MERSYPLAKGALEEFIVICTLARSVAIAGMVIPFCSDLARADEKFEKFTSGAGRFTVEMPGKPTESTKKTQNGAELHYAVAKPSIIEQYQVVYFDLPENIVKGNEPKKIFKLYTDGEYADAKIEKQKDIAFGADKLPGTEYRADTVFKADNGGMVPVYIRERLVLSGNRIYVVQFRAAANKNLLDSKEANQFFDSFQVTK
jgi:hypothetical protein